MSAIGFAASRNPTLSALWITHPDYAFSTCAKALSDHRGNVAHAAKALGISRSTLKNWLVRTPPLRDHVLHVRRSIAATAQASIATPAYGGATAHSPFTVPGSG